MDQKETEQWWNLGAVKRRLVTYRQPCSFPLLCPGALPCRGGLESAERLGLSWMTCLSLLNVTLIKMATFMSSLLLQPEGPEFLCVFHCLSVLTYLSHILLKGIL